MARTEPPVTCRPVPKRVSRLHTHPHSCTTPPARTAPRRPPGWTPESAPARPQAGCGGGHSGPPLFGIHKAQRFGLVDRSGEVRSYSVECGLEWLGHGMPRLDSRRQCGLHPGCHQGMILSLRRRASPALSAAAILITIHDDTLSRPCRERHAHRTGDGRRSFCRPYLTAGWC